MNRSSIKIIKIAVFALICALAQVSYAAFTTKGIYITQPTFENTATLKGLIAESKKVGINTFIIDLALISKRYDKNMALVKAANIRYVARIVVFPKGGTRDQVSNQKIWEKRFALAKHALELGATEIQLDYIRYNSKQKQVQQNAKDVYQVIKWFKTRVTALGGKLEVAVFGESCFKPSLAIGQDLKLFADTIDSLNPMLYPSHFYPYLEHSNRPYETVYNSLMALNKQFDNKLPFNLYPYIEVNNFRYAYSPKKRVEYIYKQIQAAKDAGAQGWYAWSANNKYKYLFQALNTHPVN